MKNYMILTFFVFLMMSCASSKKTNNDSQSADNIDNTEPATKSAMKNLTQPLLPHKTIVKGSSGVIKGVEKGNYVFKSVGDLRKFSESSFINTIKYVDFEKDILLAVIDEKYNTGGYSLEITKVVSEESDLVCYYKTTSPSATDLVTMAFTQPYHFIQIPKTSKNIVFKKI